MCLPSCRSQVVLSSEYECVQLIQVVRSFRVWPLEEGQEPPLALAASPCARSKRRPGYVCWTTYDAKDVVLKPLDRLRHKAVCHAYLKCPTWFCAAPNITGSQTRPQ